MMGDLEKLNDDFSLGWVQTKMNVQAFLLQDDIACVRIREESAVSEARVPVNFVVVLDNSGSMSMENKLSHVKKSLHYIINMLTSDDIISLITFNEEAKTVSPRMAMTADNKAILQQRLRDIRAEGSTNISAGIIKAREELIGVVGTRKQGILLLTDGQANFGIQDVEGMNGLIRTIVSEFPGTTISSIGYGIDHNSDLLRGIGSEGNGSYSVVENLEHVATVFGDILGGLASCAFQQVTVQVPESSQQITQLPSDIGIVRIGDLNTQGEVTILLRGIYAGDKIKVHGYDIRGLAFVNHDVSVVREASDEMLRHGRVAKLRMDVVQVMGKMRDILLRHGGRQEERTAIVERITELRGQIQTEMSIHGDSELLKFLLDELETCHRTMTVDIHNGCANHHATQILGQHLNVMALGRGVPSGSTPGRPTAPSPLPSAIQSVFSNGFQRHISSGLRTQTSQMDCGDEDHDENPVMPRYSGSVGRPIRSLPIGLPSLSSAPSRRRLNANVSDWPNGTPSEVSPVGSDEE